jgi:myo-inositol-1(or 4)-monophosphatase
MNLKDICSKIESAAGETAGFIRLESEKFDISLARAKGLHDFVSHVDLGAEKLLVEKLGEILPEAGFLVEEGTSSKSGIKYKWIVDPLDGTTNFIHKLHPNAISIALYEYDEPIAGVVYETSGLEVFSAWKDGGSWLNGKRIFVSEAPAISDSLIATGFPYKDFSRLDNYIDLLKYFLKNSQGVRRMGSASIDLAYVACGRFEAFFEYGLKPWDVAAGALIIKEAGGMVSDFSGNHKNLTGSDIIAANNLVFPELLEIVSKFMAKR